MASSGKRSYGSGSIFVRSGAFYGKWWANGRQVKRKLGPCRPPGTREGLTRSQAEARMRELMAVTQLPAPTERLTLEEVGRRYVRHLDEVMQRKPSTIKDYRIIVARHLGPFFGAAEIRKLTPEDFVAYIAAKRRGGLAVKTITNHLNFAHGVFSFAVRRGWAVSNPVAMTDRPPAPVADPDIRFLDREELEALLRAALDDLLGPTDRVLWLTAAMTGLRQGELAGLRWRDVDWSARLVRVRRSYSRGQWTTPKSRRLISMFAPSSVPMVSAPLSANFMLPVPDASIPAVEICSDRSAAGMMISAFETL
jgi:integrase